jgi:hypothetical protein
MSPHPHTHLEGVTCQRDPPHRPQPAHRHAALRLGVFQLVRLVGDDDGGRVEQAVAGLGWMSNEFGWGSVGWESVGRVRVALQRMSHRFR